MFAKIQQIHFVGIGGVGMSGIAEVLLNLGYKVSGSDLKSGAVTERLASLGAAVFEGHKPENIQGAEVVVASSAIAADNSELAKARELHIPVIQRAEMLAELMRLKYGIAVAGMHGKTTTTSMVAVVLAAGGLDPTVVVGGRVDALGSNARLGKSQYLVAEADESDRSFLKLSPIIAVVTNIDREHMDCYRNMRDVKNAFLEFMERVPFYGTVAACNDDPTLRKIIPQIRRRTVTYGTRRGSDFRVTITPSDGATGVSPVLPGANARLSVEENYPVSRFTVTYKGEGLGEFRLRVPGLHNVLNATAAIAVGVGLEVNADQIRAALEHFRGVDRRFQLLGRVAGISIVDDYGHHPTEIRATLAAARQCGFNKIHIVFQPHRYTRTRDLMDDFASAFENADSLFVLDIYAASEQPIEGITAEALVARINANSGGPARYANSFADAVAAVTAAAREGDMILTLGAGSVSHIGPMILEKLRDSCLVSSAVPQQR
ncbi:MAG: UDP-N-acetylmuramate--L-alanine ligase [Terriglobales bacterium]